MREPILIGRTYGYRTVLSVAPRYATTQAKGYARWTCSCACGRTHHLSAYEIRRGGRCKVCSNGLRASLDAAFNRVVSAYRRNARRRGLAWALNDADARVLLMSDCFYCGGPPGNIGRSASRLTEFTYNGLDRKDNVLGYETTNVVPCCRVCNWAKGRMSFDDFMAWLDRVCSHRRHT